MNSQTAWSGARKRQSTASVTRHSFASRAGIGNSHDDTSDRVGQNAGQNAGQNTRPWDCPRTVEQSADQENYLSLKDRLATIPTRSKQKRQSLYLDLWTGQHWLGVKLSSPAKSESESEILKPVSVDTALSVATVGTYRLLNQPLFAKS